jgi:hypothetical protein
MKFKMGQTVKDAITGFEGVITGYTAYITGCTQILVQPRVKADGSPVDAKWIDEDRLSLTNETAIELPRTQNGFDVPAPVR